MTLDELRRHQQRRAWAQTIEPGHKLRPKPQWNQTERMAARRLPAVVEVIDVERGPGWQYRVGLTVASITGRRLQLSAGWFEPLESDERAD